MTTVDDARNSPLKFFTLVVTSQPANATGVIGGQVSFSATFLTNNPTLVTYNWQIQTDGSTWGDLVETAGYYEGVTTTTLTVKAIDNYLATRTTRNFRLRALFSGSVPTFTNAGALTVPIHTNFTPSYSANGLGLTGFTTGMSPAAPAVTGFSGPFTYSWVQLGGSAFVCGNPVAPMPPFTFGPAASNIVYESIWQCTITNGVQSVTTDPLYFYAVFIDPPTGSSTFEDTTPAISADGALLFDFAKSGPWAISFQHSIRRTGIVAAVTPDTPNAKQSTFSLNGLDIPGTCVAAIATAPVVGVVPFPNSYALGCTAWGL
jgi:hypothetical protein